MSNINFGIVDNDWFEDKNIFTDIVNSFLTVENREILESFIREKENKENLKFDEFYIHFNRETYYEDRFIMELVCRDTNSSKSFYCDLNLLHYDLSAENTYGGNTKAQEKKEIFSRLVNHYIDYQKNSGQILMPFISFDEEYMNNFLAEIDIGYVELMIENVDYLEEEFEGMEYATMPFIANCEIEQLIVEDNEVDNLNSFVRFAFFQPGLFLKIANEIRKERNIDVSIKWIEDKKIRSWVNV